MRVMVDDLCIRCSLCADGMPEVFEYDTKADVIRVKQDPIPSEMEQSLKQMATDCAVQAIRLT